MAREKAVVVGAGGISNAWFGPLVQEEVNVAAVVDLRLEAARGQIEKYGLSAEASTDLKAMLEKHRPDFAVDLTIPESHCSVTCAALEAGCHVVSEKPMASGMEEARKMVRAAEKTGRMYMVSQSRRWDARHKSIQEAVARGRIGELTTVDCGFYLGAHFGGFRDEMPSPLILDMAIHHFDLVRYMAGADPVAVYAKEFNPKGSWYKGDAAALCIFEMTDGVMFAYRGSWCSEGCHTDWNGNWRFVGASGSILYEQGEAPRGQAVAGDTGFNRPLNDFQVSLSEVAREGMHGGLGEMLNYLRTGAVPQTECHDNIKSLAMVFAAIESSRTGQRVPVMAME
ncbi:MAG: Gfo/Idh/MocA family oxidoreductase [Armatimonadetes bacterium]|nr:Gfo/Idh/MocA family oxidoreductase [Armatimonadota bacterium]